MVSFFYETRSKKSHGEMLEKRKVVVVLGALLMVVETMDWFRTLE